MTGHQFLSDASDTAVSSRENLFEELSARLAAGEDIVGHALPDSSDSSTDCIDDAKFPDADDPQLPTMKRMEQGFGLLSLSHLLSYLEFFTSTDGISPRRHESLKGE